MDIRMFLTLRYANCIIAKLYSNSLLSTLNARGGWGDDSMQGSRNTTGGISIPMSIATPRTHEHQLAVPRNTEGVKVTVRSFTDLQGRLLTYTMKDFEENSFEMEESSKSRVRQSQDIEQGGYSVHELKHGGDRPLSSDVELKL
jgi:hypothetical protein